MEKAKEVNPEAVVMLSNNRGEENEQQCVDMLFEGQPEQDESAES